MNSEQRAELRAGVRYFDIDLPSGEIEHARASVDADARTAELAFSSTTPVDRGWMIEILEHAPGSVDVGPLNNGAPLLVDHDRGRQVGAVVRGSARIDADQTGRARVQFGRGVTADDEFLMVQDGLRSKVSVGYRIHHYDVEPGEGDAPDVVRVTKWTPVEISLVAIPADERAGVGRSQSTTEPEEMEGATNTKPDTRAASTAPDPIIEPEDVQREIQKALRSERRRVEQIQEAAALVADNPDVQQLAQECIRDQLPLSEFNSRIVPLLAKGRGRLSQDAGIDGEGTPKTELGLERKDIKRYSIMRACRALAMQAAGGRHWSDEAPFEFECTQLIQDKLDREAKGIYVPYDIQRSGGWIAPGMPGYAEAVRAAPMDVSENDDLVATMHMAGSYIEALRANAVVMQLGARMMGGLVGNVDLPRTDTPASFGWLAEDASSADTELVTGTVALTPKTVSGSVPITRRLRKQSSPDVEALVRQDLVQGAALAIDLGALSGTGSSGQPTGVTVISGTSTSTIASAGAPTWAETVEFESDVEGANALQGSLAWVTTAAVKGTMKTTVKESGAAAFICSESNVVNGYPLLVSTQLAANSIIFGNWSEVIVAMWGVLDLRMDTATNAAKDRLTIRAFQDVDIGIRHAASFCKNA